jgi:DNA-binding XRE family transcriptional regulator
MNIYILRLEDSNEIKVGKANSILERISTLPYEFDLKNSFYYYLGDKALKYEQALHILLENVNIDKASQDGSTEFYPTEVGVIIEDLMVLIGIERMSFEQTHIGNERHRELISLSLHNTYSSLRRLRLELGYTQKELSEHSGVSLGTLKRFEQGITGVGYDKVLTLADTLAELPEKKGRVRN